VTKSELLLIYLESKWTFGRSDDYPRSGYPRSWVWDPWS